MTITYPRIFPFHIASIAPPLVFTPDRLQNVSRSRGGDVDTSEYGRSLWRIDARTAELDIDQFEEMQAWFDSLRGSLNKMVFRDPGRERPRAYPGTGWAGISRHSGGAFDGTCTLSASAAYSATLSNLPSTYKAMAGDMLCWGWGSTATLHRVMETVTAVNGVVSVTVEPDIPPGSAPGITVYLERAFAHFKLTEPVVPSRAAYGGQQISFKAIQVLR